MRFSLASSSESRKVPLRSLAVTPPPPVLPFIVVLAEPRIKVRLQGRDRFVDLFAEGDAVELVERGLVQSLDDPVGLRRLGLCSVWSISSKARYNSYS